MMIHELNSFKGKMLNGPGTCSQVGLASEVGPGDTSPRNIVIRISDVCHDNPSLNADKVMLCILC